MKGVLGSPWGVSFSLVQICPGGYTKTPSSKLLMVSYFSRLWRLEVQGQGAGSQCLERAGLLGDRWHLLTESSHGGRASGLLGVSYKGANPVPEAST